MAFNANTTPFLMPVDYTNPSFGTESSVQLITSGGLTFDYSGPSGTMELKTEGNLEAINDILFDGFVVLTNAGTTAAARAITSSSGSISVANGDGAAGDVNINVAAGTTVQQIKHAYNSVFPAALTGTTINWVPATGIGVTLLPTPGHAESINVELTADFLPDNTSVLLTSLLPNNSFNLASLASGILKYTVSGSIATPARAVPGTDYLAPTASLTQLGALTENDGAIIVGAGGIWTRLDPGTVGKVLTVGVGGTSVSWEDAASDPLATYVVQTATDMPANAVNVGAVNAKLGIGLEAPVHPLDIKTSLSVDSRVFGLRSSTDGSASNETGGIFARHYGGTGGFAEVLLASALGNSVVPAQITVGKTIGAIGMSGYNNATSFTSVCARMFVQAAEDFTTTALGTNMFFETVRIGTTTRVNRLAILNNGFIGMTNATPVYPLDLFTSTANGASLSYMAGHLVSDSSAVPGYGGLVTDTYVGVSNGGGSRLYLRQSRGSFGGGSQSILGDILGTVTGWGATGSSFATVESASMRFVASSNYGTNVGGSIDFYTTEANTSALRMTIASNGRLGIGTAINTVPSFPLDLFTSSANLASLSYMAAHFVSDSSAVPGYGGLVTDTYVGNSTGGGSRLYLRQSRGSFGGGGATLQNDLLGSITAWGATGAAFATVESASIRFVASSNYGTTVNGSMDFYTTLTNTSALQMTLDPNGQLGIGTNAPQARLHVRHVGSDNIGLFESQSATGDLVMRTYGGDSAMELERANGTFATPSSLLLNNLIGELNFSGWNGGPYAVGASIKSTATVDWQPFFGANLTFHTRNNVGGALTERMVLTPTGQLAINNPTPGATHAFSVLCPTGMDNTFIGEVIGGSAFMQQIAYGGASHILLSSSNGTKTPPTATTNGNVLGHIIFNGYNGSAFATGARILTNAEQDWSVGANRTSMTFQVNNGNNPSLTALILNTISGGAGKIVVGVGVNPTHSFQVVDDDAFKSSTNTWLVPSDIRIKTNIQDVEEALPLLNAIQPRKFNYTPEHIAYLAEQSSDGECSLEADKFYYGYVADELETVIPDCVKVTNDVSGEFQNIKIVNPHNIYVLLVKAIQELSAKVAALEAQLNA